MDPFQQDTVDQSPIRAFDFETVAVPRDQDAARPSSQRTRQGASEIFKTLLIAVLVFAGARTFLLPYEVEGASMSPNLHDRDRVLVNRTVYLHFDLNHWLNYLPGVERQGQLVVFPFHMPERGDVVVLHPPFPSSQPYIKRVIGLPGETISFENGYVYINGERLDEPYIAGPITRCDPHHGCQEGTIPPGYVYVLGDNRTNSTDSRVFGPIPIDNIIGKAWFTNWPLDAIGLLPRYDYGTP